MMKIEKFERGQKVRIARRKNLGSKSKDKKVKLLTKAMQLKNAEEIHA